MKNATELWHPRAVKNRIIQLTFFLYAQDLAPTTAIAVLGGEGESDVKGELVFTQRHPPTGPIWIKGNITGLPTGKHGLHIYQSGDLREGCDKLGGHFNPFLVSNKIIKILNILLYTLYIYIYTAFVVDKLRSW